MGRPQLAIGSLLLCVAAVTAGAAAAPHRAAAPPVRPNVVVLMTDDQALESMRVMPNVESLLARRGTSFTNSFVSFPLCCPSRATFLTGQYAHNHGVLSNSPPSGGYERLDSSNTLPVWLQRSGYLTAHVGKYLNGYGTRSQTEVPPGWTEFHAPPAPDESRYYDYSLNQNGRLERYGGDPASYQTDVLAQRSVELLRSWAPGDVPFFLSVGFLAPHSGAAPSPTGQTRVATPAPRHAGRFAAEPLPRPPSFNEADMSDKPVFVRNLPLLDAAGIAAATERYRLRLESLLAVDEAVALIVGELARLGELENTLIVFTSDNGFFHGEHRIPDGKIAFYSPSIRVPLILRGPGVPSGIRLRQPVSNIDLAPTIVAAARARAERTMDGRSLWPILGDRGLFWGRTLLLETAAAGGSALAARAVQTPRWVYSEYVNREAELYDLSNDPHEMRSIHADPSKAAVRADLARRLAALRSCNGSSCRQGPALAPTVRVSGKCPTARAAIGLRGADLGRVTRVIFLAGNTRLAVDRAAPYRATLRLRPRPTVVRVHSVLDDGREVTHDKRTPGCSRA